MADLSLTNASDACLLAAGTVVVGRWSAAGLTADVLQELDTYSEATIGAIGPRAVYKLSDATVSAITQPSGTVRGVISLHPDGYALVQVDDTHLALWQRTGAAVWEDVAFGEVEAEGSLSGSVQSDDFAFYGPGAPAIRPGTYRLEVFGGEVWALAFGGGRQSRVLRGSSLVAPKAADLLPTAVIQSYSLGGNVQVGGQTTAYQGKARWRERWCYRGEHGVTLYGETTPWFDLLHFFFPQPVMADGTAVYGVGLNSNAFRFAQDDWPATCPDGAKAGEWARFDDVRLLRNDVDCLPLSGRATGGALWMLGVDAAGVFPLSQWAQALAVETGEYGDYYSTRTDLLVPSALYRLGAADPTEGAVVWGTGTDADGWYPLWDGTDYDAIYLDEDGLYIVWFDDEDGHWVLTDLWPVTVADTGTEADGEYTPAGMANGHPTWTNEDGTWTILWCPALDVWVLIETGTDCADAIFTNEDEVWPWEGEWFASEGDPPTVTQGATPETLFTDGTGTAPWQWPDYEVEPPSGGEVVVYATRENTDRLAVAVRLVPQGDLSTWENWRAIVRTEGGTVADPDPAVDEWSSYRDCTPGPNILLPEPGTRVRIGFIGPAEATVDDLPGFDLAIMREGP
jgi:hypothetical protein